MAAITISDDVVAAEVTIIQCEPHDGAKTFPEIKLGKIVKLAEGFAESAQREASGCTC